LWGAETSIVEMYSLWVKKNCPKSATVYCKGVNVGVYSLYQICL
jgi:hypothetical protein